MTEILTLHAVYKVSCYSVRSEKLHVTNLRNKCSLDANHDSIFVSTELLSVQGWIIDDGFISANDAIKMTSGI